MDTMKLMLAIPVLRSRVAPVFNWCSRICIFAGDDPEGIDLREEMEMGSLTAFSRLEALRKRGVTILICGALSPDLLTYGEQIGLKIIPGVAGEIDEVLKAFGSRELDQPRFWMPGCRGPRRYRGRCSPNDAECGSSSSSGGMSKQPSRSRDSGMGICGATLIETKRGGPGGVCICPQCGKTLPHRRGIPCTQVVCPLCRHFMVKK